MNSDNNNDVGSTTATSDMTKKASENTINDQEQFDDELDEDFEEDVAENNTSASLESIVKSFSDPKGVEDLMNSIKDATRTNNVKSNGVFDDDMKKHIQSMPREKLEQLYKSMMSAGLGGSKKGMLPEDFGKHDFASVTNNHRLSAHDKLRQRLAEKQGKRKALKPQEKAAQKNNKKQGANPKNNELVKKNGNNNLVDDNEDNEEPVLN
jgi:hypothetical protein